MNTMKLIILTNNENLMQEYKRQKHLFLFLFISMYKNKTTSGKSLNRNYNIFTTSLNLPLSCIAESSSSKPKKVVVVISNSEQKPTVKRRRLIPGRERPVPNPEMLNDYIRNEWYPMMMEFLKNYGKNSIDAKRNQKPEIDDDYEHFW